MCGDRSTNTGIKLWEKVKNVPHTYYATDYWKSYGEFIPPGEHIQSKAETFTVEGFNSRIRHYLARFRRSMRSRLFQKLVDRYIEIKPSSLN